MKHIRKLSSAIVTKQVLDKKKKEVIRNKFPERKV